MLVLPIGFPFVEMHFLVDRIRSLGYCLRDHGHSTSKLRQPLLKGSLGIGVLGLSTTSSNNRASGLLSG